MLRSLGTLILASLLSTTPLIGQEALVRKIIEEGDLESLRVLLQHDLVWEAGGRRERVFPGPTPLHVAARVGDVGAIELLLSPCPNAFSVTTSWRLSNESDPPPSYGRPLTFVVNGLPLHLAAAAGHADALRVLLAYDACPRSMVAGAANAANRAGQTALHLAASNEVVADGADVSARDSTGWTVLMHAIWNGDDAVASSLRAAGASIEEPLSAKLAARRRMTWSVTENPVHAVREALEGFRTLRREQTVPGLLADVTRQGMTTTCYVGALWGFGVEVFPLCDEGIRRFPGSHRLLLGRAIGHEMAGNTAGSVADLTAYGRLDRRNRDAVAEWIPILRQGGNPFLPGWRALRLSFEGVRNISGEFLYRRESTAGGWVDLDAAFPRYARDRDMFQAPFDSLAGVFDEHVTEGILRIAALSIAARHRRLGECLDGYNGPRSSDSRSNPLMRGGVRSCLQERPAGFQQQADEIHAALRAEDAEVQRVAARIGAEAEEQMRSHEDRVQSVLDALRADRGLAWLTDQTGLLVSAAPGIAPGRIVIVGVPDLTQEAAARAR